MSPQHEHLNHDTPISIRTARAGDQATITRLSELDGHRRLQSSPLLVAELDGEVLAALPLDGGNAIADPFRPTADLVEMLELRAGQLLDGATGRPSLRARLSRIRRGGPGRPALAPATPGNAGLMITRD
ncbi:MAG: hypothetical protein ACRDKV_08745 [Solirubrobacterales bacterium]